MSQTVEPDQIAALAQNDRFGVAPKWLRDARTRPWAVIHPTLIFSNHMCDERKMMSASKPSDWWTVLGNLGLLLGLVLVGYQIMQTNDLARADTISQGITAGLTMDLAVIGEKGAEVLTKVNHKSDDLTDEDIAILANIHRSYIGIAMRQVIMREYGMTGLPESIQAQDFAFLMNSEFGRMYWDASKDILVFPDSFITEVDRSLDDLEPNTTRVDIYRRNLERRQR